MYRLNQEAGVEATGTQRMLEMVVHLKNENANTSGLQTLVQQGTGTGFPAKSQEPEKS